MSACMPALNPKPWTLNPLNSEAAPDLRAVGEEDRAQLRVGRAPYCSAHATSSPGGVVCVCVCVCLHAHDQRTAGGGSILEIQFPSIFTI